MKFFSFIFLGLMISGCKTTTVEQQSDTIFYVGTYTKKESKGIYKYSISKNGKLKNLGLVAALTNPTFLAKSKDKKVLFAVGETSSEKVGLIRSYQIHTDSLQLLSKQETGGSGPCFVAVNDKNYVLTANYGGGSVGLLKANSKGELAPILNIQQHEGNGTTDRQKAPHAHSTWFHPTKNEVISVDLGTNELWFSTIDETKNELVLTNQKALKMADGAGPRHLTFHPNNKWIYVLNELNNTVSLVKEKENRYYIENSITTLPTDFTAYSKAADIHISKDGKFLYASNRGHESIAIFKVNPKNGSLKNVGYESVLGKHPRNFSLSPDNNFLLVANQDSDNIVSFKRNPKTGELTLVDEIFAPTPVCVLF
ncbi:lactonase family protein [uncultured Polaribacter sp.]|uniref:lactonase family protein n=1 Tax=uncultured Polaribacter sp. TaxID=174711 RepID=UPI00261239C5|nr:lactonase family protein [uncultured Polaribacter sp.]